MRRRQQPAALTGDRPAAALTVGPCVEVWGGADPFTARRRWVTARRSWLEARGIANRGDQARFIPANSTPWSVAFLIADGREDQARSRLARAGCTPSDIPALRAQAAELIEGA